MQEEYQLGMELRKKYVDEYHLLPANYQADTIYIRSSDFDRTLMSAQSLLMGLYPLGTGPLQDDHKVGLPYAYQPIPIHTLPKNLDDVLLINVGPRFRLLLAQYVYTRPDWREKTAELQNKFPEWSRLTGVKITNLEDLDSLADTLHIHQIHHIPMPQGLSDKDINQIIEAGDFAFAAQFKPNEIGDEK